LVSAQEALDKDMADVEEQRMLILKLSDAVYEQQNKQSDKSK